MINDTGQLQWDKTKPIFSIQRMLKATNNTYPLNFSSFTVKNKRMGQDFVPCIQIANYLSHCDLSKLMKDGV